MKKILRGSETGIVVVHEIYGVNRHMDEFCGRLANAHADVYCPDLLNRPVPFGYEEEGAAYANFMAHAGFERSAEKVNALLSELRSSYKKLYVVGFSVGATIAWLCGRQGHVDGVAGYYGSRIRDYTTLTPDCPVLLFFPSRERAFPIQELIETLKPKRNVEVRQYAGEHGFGDPFSANYHRAAAAEAFTELQAFIQRPGGRGTAE